jgi:hypothetical protein
MACNLDQFKQSMAANNVSLADQYVIVLAYLADHADSTDFYKFVGMVLAELSGRVGVDSPALQQHLASEPAAVPQPEVDMALMAFFDRNLAKAATKNFIELPGRPTASKLIEAVMPHEEHVLVTALLDGSARVADGCQDGDVILGYKTRLDNGDWAAFALTYAVRPFWTTDAGVYLDAYVVLSDATAEQHPNWVGPSLPPQNSIADVCEFKYPDGLIRNVKLVSA